MVTEGLNKIAIATGRKVRETLENEIVDLDSSVALCQADYDKLKREAEKKSLETNKLHKLRADKLNWLRELDSDIRELSRPRDGFPYLDDVAYETRMHEIRVTIQESSEEMAKRASWSE